MTIVQGEFVDREPEIARYFDFLGHFDRKEVGFNIPEGSATSLPSESEELYKTLLSFA